MSRKPIPFSSFGGYRLCCWSWWKDLWRTITTGWIYDCWMYWHRARYGWCPRDVWSLDHYLNGVLGGALAHLAEHGAGAPNGYPAIGSMVDAETDFEKWEADLKRWGKAFADAARDDYYEIHGTNYDAWHKDEQARREAVHQALRELQPVWDALWI